MPHPQPIITFVSALDWPDDDAELEEVEIQCAGRSYLSYESRLLNRREFLHGSSFRSSSAAGGGTAADDCEDDDDDDAAGKKKSGGGVGAKKEFDLLTMSDRKLKKLSYYQVLSRSLPMHASPDEIRRAYHRACLRYHPDKTGRDEEDEVFLLVKAAFDTLSDPMKRRSYDSTVDFDESIPREGVGEADFYAEYGPVFERNLRFASCNDPMNQVPGGGGAGAGGGNVDGGATPASKKGKGGKKKAGASSAPSSGPPPFGDDDTPLPQVHAFYDFWIHFDSWRDFTLRASSETEHDVDAADSRDEKRWMKQEIERKMKKMKKDEMARINLLVERAMAADPRLRRERERLVRERREREEGKRKAEEERALRERIEREVREREMAVRRAEEGECSNSPIVESFAMCISRVFFAFVLSNNEWLISIIVSRVEKEGRKGKKNTYRIEGTGALPFSDVRRGVRHVVHSESSLTPISSPGRRNPHDRSY
jgi:curved DNA-binding protein CbpA